jgi:phosphoglycerate dehydrogenase-like enzyme
MMASDVMLTNSAGVHAIPIAEYVVAGVLHFFRGLDVAAEQQRERKWDKQFFTSNDTPVREVAGARVLVVGAGGIGRAVARQLTRTGATVRSVGRRERADPELGRVAPVADLPGLLPSADFMILAVPLTAETAGLTGAVELARMRAGSWLINLARGAVVDEEALIAALQAGIIGGAALDVFEHEPLPLESPLLKMDNVMLAPHNSNSSPAAWERVHWSTIHNLLDGLGISPSDLNGAMDV